MKKIYIALSLAALVLTLGACQKNLDIPQKSVLSTEDFYANATAEDAEALIGSVYHLYWGGRDVTCVNGIEKIMFLNALDDDHYPGGGSFTDNANNFQDAGNYNVTSADAAPKIMYKGVYSVIYHCNLILEKIPVSNDARIARVKAEANFLRALAMFDAVRWWGTPPLADHLLSQDEYYQANTPTEDSINWILARMKEAADALPAISGKGQQKAFGARISKHAALAYRGKVALWYGQKFDKKEYITEAVNDLKTVIDSNLYGLVSDMFIIERQAGDFCEEYVFEHNSGDNDGFPGDPSNDLRHTWTGWPSSVQLPSCFFGGWGWNAVSKEFGEFLAAHEGGIEKPRFKSTIHTYEQVLAMRRLCQEVLEPLRQHYGKPIRITSGFRCEALNKAVGGVGRSQHMLGEAADLSVPNEQVARDWFQWIVRNTNFDQMLFEHSSRLRNRWLHVSCRWDRKRNRHQAIYNYKVS